VLTSAELFTIYALGIGALELVPEGRKLKSGRVSPYFFNSGRFTTGKSLDQLAHAYIVSLTRCFDDNVEVIFGPAYKGIPLSVAIALQLNRDVGYAFNRKETKRHGEGGDVIGMDLTGKRVIIVDDVISTGESKREAVEIIRTHGGTPIGCVIAFDRQERGCETDLASSAVQEFERLFDIPLVAVATLADLISVLQMTATGGDKNAGDSLEMILTYQAHFGISS
jgi:orotate phosphoribosyltransferase